MNYEEAKQLQTELSAMYETGDYNEKNDLATDYEENVWLYMSPYKEEVHALELTFFRDDSDNFDIVIRGLSTDEKVIKLTQIAKQLLTGAITWEQGSELIEGVEA